MAELTAGPERRISALDGLRGCAVIAVVLFHLELAPQGFMGVDVFFVLSGFLITSMLTSESARTGTVSLRRFYVRRILRLYPALVVVCAFALAVALVTGRAVAEVGHDALFSVLYLSNLVELQSGLLSHTWTLSIEEQFYLLWPLLLLLGLSGGRRGRVAALAWSPAMAAVVVIAFLDLAQGADGGLHTYVRAMGLPLGCALALVGDRLAGVLARAWLVCAGALALALFVPLPDELTTGWPVSVGALLAVPLVARAARAPVPGLSGPFLRWFGLRSYSLYLWHLPLISLAANNGPDVIPHPVLLAGGLGASLVAAELSYRYVEQTVLRWRDRHLPGRAPTAAETARAGR